MCLLHPSRTALLLLSLANVPAVAAPACTEAELERDKSVARAVFEEVLSKGRIDENEHLYHPQFVAHGLTRDVGRAEDREASRGWRQAVPDLRMVPLRLVAECGMVAVHWEGSGTNSGSGNGLPATGRSLRVQGMTFFKLDGGQIREEWTSFDQYTMLKDLGLLDG